jgi:hypothetical protein
MEQTFVYFGGGGRGRGVRRGRVTHEIYIYLLTYSIIRVLLEKLTGSLLVNKFLALYGTRRYITAFNNVRHISLVLNQLDQIDTLTS